VSERVEEPLAAGGGRQPPQLLEGGDLRAGRNDEQRIELLAVGLGQVTGEEAPEALVSTFADTSDIALQHGDPGKQDLLSAQPGDGMVEQQAGALTPEPGASEQPTHEAPAALGVGIVGVRVAPADVDGVDPTHARGAVAVEVVGWGEIELLGKVGDKLRWYGGGLGEEGVSIVAREWLSVTCDDAGFPLHTALVDATNRTSHGHSRRA
jgi:hypothetical protein